MATPIATLSMYDWPETRSALEQFWKLIEAELLEANLPAPDVLQQVTNQMPLWTSPDLVIGQTCGWPYANLLKGIAHPFARFDYDLEDCPAGTYRSVYIGQSKEDAHFLKDAKTLAACPSVAMNGEDSQSGFHVFEEVSALPSSTTIPAEKRVVTGAHRNSVRAVANGEAQIAAIDAVAFELAKRHETEAVQAIEVIGFSQAKPGLPLITSPSLAGQSDALFQTVKNAYEKLNAADQETLLIKDVLPATGVEYDVFLVSEKS